MLNTRNTKYVSVDGSDIAYQVWGDGSAAIIFIPGMISHLDVLAEDPEYRHWISLFTETFRVIVYDKRGQGMSDRDSPAPGPEQRLEEINAIADAENIEKFSIFGLSEGATIALLYSAIYPDRVYSTSVFGGFAKFCNAADYNLMFDEESLLSGVKHWGTGRSGFIFSPLRMPEARAYWARFEKMICTPTAYREMIVKFINLDIRKILPEIRIPIFVSHRRDDKAVPVSNGRYLADKLVNSKYIEYGVGGHIPWMHECDELAKDVIHFATSHLSHLTAQRNSLRCVLFTDIIDSTTILSEIGDKRWSHLISAHDKLALMLVEEHGGVLVKTTGDGILSYFNGPERAIKFCRTFIERLVSVGISIRCAMHLGQVEIRENDISGLAVNIASRILDKAASNKIVITNDVRNILPHTDFNFRDLGDFQFKGLPSKIVVSELLG